MDQADEQKGLHTYEAMEVHDTPTATPTQEHPNLRRKRKAVKAPDTIQTGFVQGDSSTNPGADEVDALRELTLKEWEREWEANRAAVKQEAEKWEWLPITAPPQRVQAAGGRKKHIPWRLESPYTAGEPKHRKGKGQKKIYDPMVRIPRHSAHYFTKWINRPEQDHLLHKCVLSMKKQEWWTTLLRPNEFTSDETVDLLFIFLRNKILSDKSPAVITHS